MKNWYVYSIVRNGQCVYIGKGSGKRCKLSAKQRNGEALILVNGVTHEKALELEKSFIQQIGIENLENKNCGGTGRQTKKIPTYLKGDKWDKWRVWMNS